MTPTTVRRPIRLLGLLGAVAGLACASVGAPASPAADPRPLPRVEGAIVTGRLDPGETASYSIELETGEYFEIHHERPPEEVRVLLFAPGVEPSASPRQAESLGEHAPNTTGQVLWHVISVSGLHHIRVEPTSGSAVDSELAIRALRPATEKDLSAYRGFLVWSQAETLRRAGRFDEALELFDRAFELYLEGGYRRGQARTSWLRATILQVLGRPEEAREQLLGALAIYRELGDRHEQAGTLVLLASLEREVARWDSMHQHLETGLGLARELGNREVEAGALIQYCKALMDQGQTVQAVARCRGAVALWEEMGWRAEGVDALINLGYIHFYQGELDEARAYYTRGLDVLEKHPHPEREATLRNNLALLHEAGGEYQVALASLQAALEAYDRLGRTGFSAKVLQNMGRIHQRLRNPATSYDFYLQALDRMVEAEDLLGRIGVLHALGDLQVEEAKLVEARRTLEEALELSRGAGSRLLLAASLTRIGELELQGRPEQALVPLDESRQLYRASEHRWGEARAVAGLAAAHAAMGEEERALDWLIEATALNEAIGNRAGLAESHYRIARIERGRGNLEAARGAIEQAEAVLDAVRLMIGTDDLRSLYSATTRPYHELHVAILMAQHRRRPEDGHDAEALRESERARSRSLLEILSEAELRPGPEVSRELLADRAALQQRLNAKEIERQILLADEAVSPSALFRVKLDIERLLTDLRGAERRIRAQSPRYAALTQPQPVTVVEIQRSLLDGETALLEYSLGEERSFLWVVTNDGLETHELPASSEIEASARCFHWLITAYGQPPAADRLTPEAAACLGERLRSYTRSPPGESQHSVRHRRRLEIVAAFERTGDELSRLVLAPAAAAGPLAHRLAIVADGALEYVPFAALPEPGTGGRPLVETHELARLPSASVLAFQRSQPASAAATAGELAIVADPLYSREDDRVTLVDGESRARLEAPAGAVQRGVLSGFDRLTFSGREADAIARFTGPNGALLAIGPDATRELVLGGALAGYRYVHFATHAVVDTQYPQFSRLVLSLVDSQGQPVEDGFLRLHDVYGLALDAAEMVVLSACDTALGREIRGEGLVGLTRGFLYAGAERVVASLWPVQDLATARLMEHLYRGLLEEKRPPADALRRAQLGILAEPDGAFAFPYYWAGFVLQGEWR
ncbi:MAG TPA: CHAT domain-containing protein [Thermoanaerobaculia bacterium]|nr:CHAT domain-containing protein [Thermoanaerobaculia bacterium]